MTFHETLQLKPFLLDLPLVFEEGRCGPHLPAGFLNHAPLIMRLWSNRHLS